MKNEPGSSLVPEASSKPTERGTRLELELFKKAVRFILSIATITSISENDIKAVLHSDINDFEDAAQLSCAVDSECDFLISSDRKWKGYTPLPVYTPKEFCDLVFED